MKTLLALLPLLAAWPVAIATAADPEPFPPTPLRLQSHHATTFPLFKFPSQPTLVGIDSTPLADLDIYLHGASLFLGFYFPVAAPKEKTDRSNNQSSILRHTFGGFSPDTTTTTTTSDPDDPDVAAPGRRVYTHALPHSKKFNPDGKFFFNGDFPGPGYRDQRSQFSGLTGPSS